MRCMANKSQTKKKVNYQELLKGWQSDPFDFIYDMWGLKPQPLKKEFADMVDAPAEEFEAHMFEDFVEGEHLTWQQFLIIRAVKWAANGKEKRRVSVSSGHGTGKTAVLAMIMLWFIICFKDAQIPCTAPTQHQLHDVLWKEVKIWMNQMPRQWAEVLDHTAGYLRIKKYPETWFARARTARKEAPEALAGVHGDHVLFLIDEASGVPDEVFDTAEGALTGENVLVVMISNYTRVIGYFHNSHTSDKDAWQTIQLSSEDSPIVEQGFVERILNKCDGNIDADEYRIRVRGIAPKADAVDDKGYVPLFVVSKIDIAYDPDYEFVGTVRLGVDPSGEGKDKTSWCVRDNFKASIVASEKTSTGKSIAQKTITIMDKYGIPDNEVDIDAFGEGVDAVRELALARKAVNAVNVGHPALDPKVFRNLRAEAYWAFYLWLKQGGVLLEGNWEKELPSIRYRRELSGKLSIMSKREMKKAGFESPNDLDAAMLTFTRAADENDIFGDDVETTIEEKSDFELLN